MIWPLASFLDAHNNVCPELHEACFLNCLLPNVPAISVMIIDSGSYQSSEVDEIVTMTGSKHKFVCWLNWQGIDSREGLLKHSLLQIVSATKYNYNKDTPPKKYPIDYEKTFLD
ncbi:hypothetical protein Trydic_g11644 [Trypoxylus dichotomus]